MILSKKWEKCADQSVRSTFGKCHYSDLTHYLLVLSAHNLCKQIRLRSGRHFVGPDPGPIFLALLKMVFPREFFQKVDFEKNQTTKSFPVGKELKRTAIL